MELWLDTSNLSLIKQAKELGCLYGITTNPTILSASGKAPLDTLESLLDIHKGPITAQVTAFTAGEMVKQGRALHRFSKQLVIKVPASLEGLKATYALSQEGISIMATAMYDLLQAISAFKAGATYGVLYVGRMENAGLKPIETLYLIKETCPSFKLLAASIRSKEAALRMYSSAI